MKIDSIVNNTIIAANIFDLLKRSGIFVDTLNLIFEKPGIQSSRSSSVGAQKTSTKTDLAVACNEALRKWKDCFSNNTDLAKFPSAKIET